MTLYSLLRDSIHVGTSDTRRSLDGCQSRSQ